MAEDRDTLPTPQNTQVLIQSRSSFPPVLVLSLDTRPVLHSRRPALRLAQGGREGEGQAGEGLKAQPRSVAFPPAATESRSRSQSHGGPDRLGCDRSPGPRPRTQMSCNPEQKGWEVVVDSWASQSLPHFWNRTVMCVSWGCCAHWRSPAAPDKPPRSGDRQAEDRALPSQEGCGRGALALTLSP